jgi:ubiquitin C-terminal hydrolase
VKICEKFLTQTPVALTQNLSLDEFLDDTTKSATESGQGDTNSSYSIMSIVHHIGNTASSGHYTADALRGENSWVSFDDGVTRELSPQDVFMSSNKQRTAYMIMYSLD